MDTTGKTDQSGRDLTPSGRSRPRCYFCAQLKKDHDEGLCHEIQSVKNQHTARGTLRAPSALVGNGEGTSASKFRAGLHHSVPKLSPVPEDEDTAQLGELTSIVLPVHRMPNLAGRYNPIIQFTLLLKLKSLRLSHFHLTKSDDWSFVISGSRVKVLEWVAEEEAKAKANAMPKRDRLHTALVLLLGVAIGFIVVLSIAYTSIPSEGVFVESATFIGHNLKI